VKKQKSGVQSSTKRLLTFQFVTGLVVAIGFMVWKGGWEALSVMGGVSASLVSVYLLGSGVTKASERALKDPKSSMAILYFGAVKRFVVILIFFMVGLGLLGLNAPAMCAGFVAAQLGFLFNIRGASKASV
jgi:F0F1-type ATP synthase assembly protein I